MSVSVVDFFSKKRDWSKIKDHLLSWYLTPYLAKVFSVAKNFYLIDGFSGPGLFGDGEMGSPLIEKQIIEKTYLTTKNKNINFKMFCVENNSKLFNQLVNNCKNANWIKCIKGKIELMLPDILNSFEKNSFVFLYLDPFGINGFPTDLLELIKKRNDLKIEILINFSSSGCYRECMRLLGSNEFDEYFEKNEFVRDPNSSIERMNKLLGTCMWPDVANKKNAEYLLSVFLCEKLKTRYKHVLNMPVRNPNKDEIKYRMIHCSNNSDGAILMSDNMISKVSLNKMSLFTTDLEGNIVDVEKVITKVLNYIPLVTEKPIRLNQLIVNFFENEGIVCQSKEIKRQLKEMERNNRIIVIRKPEKSPNGKICSFWNEDNGRVVLLLKKIQFN